MLTVSVDDHPQNVWMRAPMSPFSLSVAVGVTTGVTTGVGVGSTSGVTGVVVAGGWCSVKKWYASRLGGAIEGGVLATHRMKCIQLSN